MEEEVADNPDIRFLINAFFFVTVVRSSNFTRHVNKSVKLTDSAVLPALPDKKRHLIQRV